MCLITEQLEPTMAKEGIICYKVLEKLYKNLQYQYCTPYQHYECNLGDLITSSLSIDTPLTSVATGNHAVFGEGVHSFSCLTEAKDLLQSLQFKTAYSFQFVVVKCIIPCGTKYYVGTCNDLASEKLLIQEEL